MFTQSFALVQLCRIMLAVTSLRSFCRHASTSFAGVYALWNYVGSDIYVIVVCVCMHAHLLHMYTLCVIMLTVTSMRSLCWHASTSFAHIYALQDYVGSDIYAVVVRAHLRGYTFKARISVWVCIRTINACTARMYVNPLYCQG